MNETPKNPHAQALGRLGGRAGRGASKARPSWQMRLAQAAGVKKRMENKLRRLANPQG